METMMIHFTLDEDIYHAAKAVLDSLGLSMEEAINLFFKAVVASNGMPFPITECEQDLIINSVKDD